MARKEKKYHYIYKITCIKNNKYYIGMHSTDNLEDGYFGGGKRIKYSVRKYGRDNHKKEILEFFENRELLKEREAFLVNEKLIKDPMCMNIQLGGGGGFINEEHKQKWIKAGSKAGNEAIKNKMLDPDYYDRWSKRIKEYWNNPNIKKKMLAGLEKNRPKFLSKESKEKIGKSNSISQLGVKNSQFGTLWISHERLGTIKIKKELLEEKLKEGWIPGRIKFKNS